MLNNFIQLFSLSLFCHKLIDIVAIVFIQIWKNKFYKNITQINQNCYTQLDQFF